MTSNSMEPGYVDTQQTPGTPSLSRFQAVNNPDKPLVHLRRVNREKVMDDVARAVEDALKR